MAEEQPQEPLFAVDQIQGNVLLGFNKDFQAFLFLEIVEVSGFRRWLKTHISSITTTADVLKFRDLLQNAKTREQPSKLPSKKVTWVNIAFSHDALAKLGMITEKDKFTDQPFRQGLRARSDSLGDPIDGEGSPQTWMVGGPANEADVILILASDNPDDLSTTVTDIKKSVSSDVRIISEQRGANLHGMREHFGFRDGISQPGVRGLIPETKTFLTPRQNPNDLNQGKPGQDLLWPGEFVFGTKYRKQDPSNATEPGLPSLSKMVAPDWAENGSFLVFRRLRQDVAAFRKFCEETAAKHGLAPDHFGAICVGRWPSGAPLLRTPTQEYTRLGSDDGANNHFEFQTSSNSILPSQTKKPDDYTDDQYPSSQGDPNGKICPFAAHIRRTNPRDDVNKSETLTHRLLRRGIPYKDESDRGLLFLSYQTSIENQFEFVQKSLANNPWFRSVDKALGYDPIIGQNNTGIRRTFSLMINGRLQEIELPKTGWVIPTGGGYFFAPSIKTLKTLTTV